MEHPPAGRVREGQLAMVSSREKSIRLTLAHGRNVLIVCVAIGQRTASGFVSNNADRMLCCRRNTINPGPPSWCTRTGM